MQVLHNLWNGYLIFLLFYFLWLILTKWCLRVLTNTLKDLKPFLVGEAVFWVHRKPSGEIKMYLFLRWRNVRSLPLAFWMLDCKIMVLVQHHKQMHKEVSSWLSLSYTHNYIFHKSLLKNTAGCLQIPKFSIFILCYHFGNSFSSTCFSCRVTAAFFQFHA